MAVSPEINSSLELTMSMPGHFSSSGDHNGNQGGVTVVRDLDMNRVPEEEEHEGGWTTVGGGGSGDGVEEDEEESTMVDGTSLPGPRKKLRLTKDQSRLLEESFRQQHTLNPRQKEALAEQLKLRPRQVEVWFQNRRARSKLKQTEMECEYLKRWFGSLTEQNRRLQREVEELRAMKVGPPTIMSPHTCERLPASALTMCPRCERVTATAGGSSGGGATTTTTTRSTTVSGPHGRQSRQSSAAC